MTAFRSVRGLSFLALLNFAPGLEAQQAPRALAIEDYYRVKTVGGLGLSPDGQWVSFTVSTRVEANNGTIAEVWLVPFDGSAAARRVSPAGANASTPSWRADGRLTFSVQGGFVVVTPTQPDSAQVTAAAAGAAGAGRGGRGGRGGTPGPAEVRSPDGQRAFVVRDVPPPARDRVYESDFDKRHQERFKGVQFDWLDYQRDGQQYPLPNNNDPAVSPPQEIFLTQGGGQGGERQLTSLAFRPTAVQWHPDSRTILFTADSLYRVELSYGSSQVWTVTTEGTVKRVSPSTDYGYQGARYSPDGRWILATRQYTTDYVIAKKLNHGGATDLVLIPSGGGAERNLTADWDYLPTGARWSPDGRYVYFTGGVGGTVHLFRVPSGGGLVEQVTKGERRIADLQMDSAMTRMVYTVHQYESLPEVWSANLDGTNERQLTQVHDDFMSTVRVAKTDRLQFRSADGWPVEGWITLPVGYATSGARYPLVVSNHGGPHSAIQYGFNFRNQYLAANGYAVLEVNFRSSTGYGEKHLWGTWGAWGTKDGQDVMAGVDLVLSRYHLDRSRVASIGHSYGGFMTNWLITQYPDRFAAAASGAGIVNWMSDYANADIARTKETEFFGKPWEDEARAIMLKQSPITYAGRARTPTLFVVGEVDRRVPFTENEQLYVALKKQGVPAKMIVYADQPHGISGHWNVVHRWLNERQWFDKYLKQQAVP